MKLHSWLLITHSSVAALAILPAVVLAALSMPTWMILVAGVLAVVAGLAAAAVVTNQVNHGLQEIERIASKGSGECESFVEFGAVAQRVGEHAARWRDAASSGLEQFREVEGLLRQLDRRATSRGNASVALHLRQVLRSMGGQLNDQVTKVSQLGGEIRQYNQQIAQGNEEQGEWIGKTTASVERISGNIDSVSNIAESAKSGADQLRAAVTGAAVSLKQSINELQNIDHAADGCERKIRSLEDHSSKVLSIVETLGALASRTDLLALNASIESVRAGEHGRGFAIVAEEIRELAEQSAQATSEVAGLVGSIQAETRDTMTLLTQERAEIASSDKRVGELLASLGQAGESSAQWVGKADEIAVVTRQQLNLVQDIVVAVERLSHTAKTNRTLAERANWNTDALAKTMQNFQSVVERLRGRGERAAEAAQETAVEQTLDAVNDSLRELEQGSNAEPHSTLV